MALRVGFVGKLFYDAEGNRVARWVQSPGNAGKTAPASGDTNITLYAWDNRDRLTSVTQYATYGGSTTQTVTYIYDAFNRWVGETITAGGTTTQSRYTYDGNQIILEFDGTGTSSLSAGSLGHRYLWGPAVDQLMADEQTSGANAGNVVWALTDNLNTVRDLATYSGGVTTIATDRVFSAYGQLLSPANPTVNCLFAFTGRPLDNLTVVTGDATGLQNNLNRWYDAGVGRWLSQDPIGFGGGDANVYRYCGNGPTNGNDPLGLVEPTSVGPTPSTSAAPSPTPAPAPTQNPAAGAMPTGGFQLFGSGSGLEYSQGTDSYAYNPKNGTTETIPYTGPTWTPFPPPPKPPTVVSTGQWTRCGDEPCPADLTGIFPIGIILYTRKVYWSDGTVTTETSVQRAVVVGDNWVWSEPDGGLGSVDEANPHGPEPREPRVPNPFDGFPKPDWRDPKDLP